MELLRLLFFLNKYPFNVFIQTLLTCCIIDLNPNTEWYLTVSQNIYLQSQRRSRDVALKRAFDVAAVDKQKREKERRNMSEIMSAQIKMLCFISEY